MPTHDVVGLGIAACDYVVALDRFPGADEKVRSSELYIEGGGTVGTALVTVARLGARAAFAGAVGDDSFGRFILDSLEEEGVDTSLARQHPGARSPFAFCVAAPPTRNVFAVAPTTPPLLLDPRLVDLLLDTTYLHMDGSEEGAAAELAREARRRGLSVSLDLQRLRDNTDALLSQADIAVVSETFAHQAYGRQDPEKAVRELYRPGMRLAAITLGERGTVASEGDSPYWIPAEPVEVVDSTGAGDVFHGALLVSLLGGHTMPTALRFASHVAGIACTQLGGRAGIPHRDDVGDWF